MNNHEIQQLNQGRLANVNSVLAEKCWQIVKLADKEGFTLLVTHSCLSICLETVGFAFVIRGEISFDRCLDKRIEIWAKQVGLKWCGN